ncbi:hypothetical protein ACIRYZ_01105 [Kitasatospora sp. NPDC101155]|uniref:hypothetical protein n=1 Tax=Kitasatospora sp. NPDC101155 TaxID=3364097 RepID=UPI00382C4825
MAAPFHSSLGPLPAAPHHRRTHRTQRLFVVAVLGLMLPLAVATAAPATTTVAGALSDTGLSVGAEPSAARPQHQGPRQRRAAGDFPRAHRHRLASAPERPGAAVEQAPDQAVQQPPAQAPEQVRDQAPGRAQDRSFEADRPDSDAGSPAPADPTAPDTVTGASDQPVAAPAVPAVLPARWQDPSTLQLPLGVGLGLIGCGLGLIGLRLRKG